MRKDYVMQSTKRRRYKAKPSRDWVPYAMVLILGLAIGSYITYQVSIIHPIGHPHHKRLSAKTESKPKVIQKERYDFYTLLKQHAERPSVQRDEGGKEGYVLQIGAFEQEKKCKVMSHRLQSRGFSVVEYHDPDHAHYCRVYVGPYATLSKAYRGQRSLLHRGYRSLLRKWSDESA